MIYTFVLLLLLFLSLRYDISGNKSGRDNWYMTMLIVFVLIAGLRWRLGIDTPNYLYSFYYEYPKLDKFSFYDYYIGKDPSFVLINSFVKSIGGRFYIVQLIHAAFVNYLIFRYIKKHTSYIFLSLLFYFLYCYEDYNMEIMRASFSIVLSLYANDYFVEKKWIKGYMLLMLGLTFHLQTLFLFITPLFMLLRLNWKGGIALVAAFIAGVILQRTLGDYIELLSMTEEMGAKAEQYTESDTYGTQQQNTISLIVSFVPYVLYILVSLYYLKRLKLDSNLLKLEPFVMIGLAWLLIQISFPITYRLVDCYKIYFVIFFSEFFVCLIKRKRKQLSLVVSYTLVSILFFPLFARIGFNLYNKSFKYYPYTSVIDRKVDRDREYRYNENSPKPSPSFNEF